MRMVIIENEISDTKSALYEVGSASAIVGKKGVGIW